MNSKIENTKAKSTLKKEQMRFNVENQNGKTMSNNNKSIQYSCEKVQNDLQDSNGSKPQTRSPKLNKEKISTTTMSIR